MNADPGRALVMSEVHLGVGGADFIGGLEARVEPGECLVVMGPSGSGKSSLLAWMAGTLDPAFTARGRLAVGDQVLTGLAPEHRRLGLLFQDDLLFPHLSVRGNLVFAMPAAVRPRAERLRRIEHGLIEDRMRTDQTLVRQHVAGIGGFDQQQIGEDSAVDRKAQRPTLENSVLGRFCNVLHHPPGKTVATQRGNPLTDDLAVFPRQTAISSPRHPRRHPDQHQRKQRHHPKRNRDIERTKTTPRFERLSAHVDPCPFPPIRNAHSVERSTGCRLATQIG